MDDFTVHIDNIQHVPVFHNGKMDRSTLITFHVGKLGPFTQPFEPGKDDPGAMNATLNQFAANLRSVQGIA